MLYKPYLNLYCAASGSGKTVDGADHRLVPGRENEGLLEAIPGSEAILELHMAGGCCLNA